MFNKLSYPVILTVILIGLIAFFAVIIPNGVFLKPRVLLGTTTDVVYLGLMALPMTYIILTGGIDLSVGFLMASAGMLCSFVFKTTENLPLAIFVCLFAGIVGGALNGLVVSKTKIPPFIATLGTMSVFNGITWFIGGSHSFVSSSSLVQIGSLRFFGSLPFQLIVLVVVFLIFDFIHNRSSLGRYLHAIGYNENAVNFSGVNTSRVKFGIYTLCGFMCGFSALTFFGRSFEINSTTGLNMNIEVITLVVLGGTSVMGGVGTIRGTFIACLIVGVLRKGLSLMGASGDVYNFVLGGVLVLSLISFAYLEKKKKMVSRSNAIKNLTESAVAGSGK
ncbi:ABC transporter permease [Anaerobiospirillum thomasii]|uniref:Autoinducer 2 import system permease protein LsrD n=1 Tax=Anaerobiospirillum thomasii TaxID=179995 RepID=A0A2X0V396_9GAMM|nr:ABC transporter permease [Anaerobiospirillum thomasii]SPT69004.1 Autoinducer 2 import system permease protein lsrD [Anaerobiospirillum thomasii]